MENGMDYMTLEDLGVATEEEIQSGDSTTTPPL